jgi:hypothetical protein
VGNTEGELNGRHREQAWERGDFDTKCACENIEEIGCFEDVSVYGKILTCNSYMCVFIYIYIYTHTHTHTHTPPSHTHTHTYTASKAGHFLTS